MKKYISLLVLSVILLSCKTEMDQAMKSADKDFILKVANEKFAKKKWADALALYDRLPNLVAGTDDAPNVVFNSAYSNYYDKNYRLAANQFKNFVTSFPQDPRKEEAEAGPWQSDSDYRLQGLSTCDQRKLTGAQKTSSSREAGGSETHFQM